MKLPKIRHSLSLIAIITGAAFVRIVTLQKLMVFTPDEEYILYITQTLVKHFHIIWIGVSALGFDFYMGPLLEYFLVPFMWIAKGDPIIWGAVTCTFGAITAYLIYFLGNKIFNKKTGIIAALIYSFSALLVFYDQQPYPTGVPLLSMLLLTSLYMTKKSNRWWIVFTALLGLVFHIHLSLLLVVFIGIYWALKHKNTLDKKTIIFSFLAFILVMLPLIGFDYFHKGSNITAPIRVFQAIGKSKTRFNLVDRLGSLAKSGSRIFYLDTGKSNTDEILYPCNSYPENIATKGKPIIVLLMIGLLIITLFKKDFWKDENKKLLIVYSLAFLLPFIFLSSIGSVEYYLLGFFPVFIILVASAISKLPKLLIFLTLSMFILYNLTTIFSASGEFGIHTKKKMVNEIMNTVGNSSFELLETGGKCQGNAGWGYLFTVYGRSPNKNTADKQFNWLLPIGDSSKTKYIVIINETRNAGVFSGFKYKFEEGGFTGYIFQN